MYSARKTLWKRYFGKKELVRWCSFIPESTTSKIKLTPMLEQYYAAKHATKEHVLLFQMGEFYEMFFEDANTVSNLLGLTMFVRGGIPMCGVPLATVDRTIQRLVSEHGLSVAICDQVQSSKVAAPKKTKQSLMQRQVVRIVTPGTLTEDSMLNPQANNFLASIAYDSETQKFGFGWTDLSTGLFQSTYGDLEAIFGDLSRQRPREVLLPDLEEENEAYARIAVFCGTLDCAVTYRPNAAFSASSGRQALKEDERIDGLTDLEQQASAALIDYIRYTQKDERVQLGKPLKHVASQHMEIDATAWKSLELSRTLTGRQQGSLLHSIDRTITASGARLLANHLSSPLLNIAAIESRQAGVKFFLENDLQHQILRQKLRQCGDVERTTQRVLYGRATPKDVRAIGDTLHQSLDLFTYLNESQECLPNVLRHPCLEISEASDKLSDLARTIRSAIVEDQHVLMRKAKYIKAGYSSDLDNIKVLLSFDGRPEAEEEKPKVLARASLELEYRRLTGSTRLKIQRQEKLGFFVEIPKEEVPLLADCPDIHFQHVHSTKAAARFKTKDLADVENRINTAELEYSIMEQAIFDDLCQQISDCFSHIQRTAQALALVDVFCSHAKIARDRNYCQPVVDNSRDIHIKDGRHPVVEESLASGTGDNLFTRSFVPNTLSLASDENQMKLGSTWLITGPNMNGKSTFLRMNAQIIALSQIGSFTPCRSARIGLVDRLFCRVGASDDLAANKSTFMVEMQETAAILNHATNRSFVLMDEIGRGTSTSDGIAIAGAVLEELCERGTRTLFATHFHELAALASNQRRLKLYQMQVVEGDSIIFAHRIREGVASNSFGLHVARLAGCPPSILRRAAELVAESSPFDPSQSTIIEDLQTLDINDLSPKAAWNLIESWKTELENPKRE